MSDLKLTRRNVLAGAGALAGAATVGYLGKAFAQDATPVTGGATPEAAASPSPATPLATPVAPAVAVPEWPFYGNTIEDVKFTAASAITRANVGALEVAWTVPVGGPISATPVIANGMVVIGAYDGILRALDAANGQAIWTYDTGAKTEEPNLKIPLGITGSAAIDGAVVYVGDAAGKLHAIDGSTGKAIWSVKPNSQNAASIWSSPVVHEGVVYVGIASVAKETGFRGAVVAVNASDGKTLWTHYIMPKGRTGGGVFAVPALDVNRGLVIVGTQNSYSTRTTGLGNVTSVIALEMTSGSLKWAFAGTHEGGKFGPADDVGFSASPNLFTASISGKDHDLVGAGQKNGIYHVLDRDTGDIVWEETITDAGPIGGMEGTSAVGDGVIVVPATIWTDPSSTDASGVVQALEASSGTTLWKKDQAAPNPAPVAIANDVVFQAGIEGVLRALGLRDGAELFTHDLGASVSGGVAVAGDLVVVGAGSPAFAPFVKAGSNQVWAFRLAASPSTPVAASPEASPAAPTETPTEVPTEAPTETPTETSSPPASPVA